MNIMEHVRTDYSQQWNPGFLSKPENLQLQIQENGRLTINGKRYLRLGKITLFNPVKSDHITPNKYVGILDTNTGQVLCFDIDTIYMEYIQKGIDTVNTNYNNTLTTYAISNQTKKIVMDSMIDDFQ